MAASQFNQSAREFSNTTRSLFVLTLGMALSTWGFLEAAKSSIEEVKSRRDSASIRNIENFIAADRAHQEAIARLQNGENLFKVPVSTDETTWSEAEKINSGLIQQSLSKYSFYRNFFFLSLAATVAGAVATATSGFADASKKREPETPTIS